MMDMYQEHILDHYREPRNFGQLPNPSFHKQGFNPLCGDKIIITGLVARGKLHNAQFTGKGCAISIAATSMLLEYAKGKPLKNLFVLTDKNMLELLGIPLIPGRMSCGLLGLNTLREALNEYKHQD